MAPTKQTPKKADKTKSSKGSGGHNRVNKEASKVKKSQRTDRAVSTFNDIELKPASTTNEPKQNKRSHDDHEVLEGTASIKKPRMDEDVTATTTPAFDTPSIQGPSSTSPAIGAAVPTSTPDILSALSQTHDAQYINIISSTSMEAKTTRILSHLASFSFSTTNPKPPIIILAAKSSCTNKMIGIVELAKREIGKQNAKWYQYNILNSVTGEKIGSKDKQPGKVLGNSIQEDEEEGTEMSFEVMKTPLEREIEGRPKIRVAPAMSICLSRVRLDTLKAAYGEQTNA